MAQWFGNLLSATALALPCVASLETHLIKATKLALDTIRANKIAIENSKTGKVTAVVAILKVFGEKFAIHGTLIPEHC